MSGMRKVYSDQSGELYFISPIMGNVGITVKPRKSAIFSFFSFGDMFL